MKQSTLSRITFIASILVLLYVAAGTLFDVYAYKFTGAVFELLWLPVIILMVACPVFSLVYWFKEKFSLRSLYLYAFFISVAAVALLWYKMSSFD